MKNIFLYFLLFFITGCSPIPTGDPLHFEKIIFGDYDISNYQIFNKKNNKKIGESTVEFKKEKSQASGEIYVFKLKINENIKSKTVCNMNVETLIPIYSEKEIKGNKIITEYKGTYADIFIKGKGLNKKLQLIDLPKNFYENDTVIFILRCFDINFWKNKKEIKFNIIIPQIGQNCIARAKLARKKEKITLNNNEIHCYKIEITSDGTQKHYAWYEINNPHRLIKYENNKNIYLLNEKN